MLLRPHAAVAHGHHRQCSPSVFAPAAAAAATAGAHRPRTPLSTAGVLHATQHSAAHPCGRCSLIQCSSSSSSRGPLQGMSSTSSSEEEEEFQARLRHAAATQQQQQQHTAPSTSTTAGASQAPFDWLSQWYPVGFVKDFNASVPHRFVLLGIPLVIWHDGSSTSQPGSTTSSSSGGGWHVFADACPHRLVPLSEGRVTPADAASGAPGRLECPYHGWQFDERGRCVAIPQQGNLNTPRACATAFPVTLQQGMLFVRPQPFPRTPAPAAAAAPAPARGGGEGATAAHHHARSSRSGVADPRPDQQHAVQQDAATTPDVHQLQGVQQLPTVAELDEGGWLTQDTWRDVPYGMEELLSNTLDASHVAFTHHRSISNRNIPNDFSGMRLTRPLSAAGGFAGIWPAGPRGGALGPQATRFTPPCLMVHKITAAARGFESLVVVYAVPTAPGRCRLLNRNAFKFAGRGSGGGGGGGGLGSLVARAAMQLVPGWLVHIGTQVPLEDDQIFLHFGELQYAAARQQGRLTASQVCYSPSKADTYVTAFRRWLAIYAGGGPFGDVAGQLQALGPRLGREQLLDRYSQHTVNCAQCSAALARIRAARSVLPLAAGISASLALLSAAVASVGLLGAAASSAAARGGVWGALTSALASLLAAVTGSGVRPVAAPAAGAAAAAGAAVMQRLLLWLGLAGACWWVRHGLGTLEARLLRGTYPPPRNLDPS